MGVASAPVVMDFVARTDRGRQRPANEDAVYAETFRLQRDGTVTDWLLLAVADGVGGHQRGDWASKKAISVLAGELPKHLAGHDPPDALRLACEASNRVTCHEASRKGISGAATTLVVALVDLHSLYWANAGDSRAYLVRGRQATQLTQDHSLVEEQVRAGQMTPEEARQSDQRNIITRSVGLREEVEFDLGGPIAVEEGLTLLLCSDGLNNVVSDDEIAAVVSEGLGPDTTARSLIEMANERGGPDNISVVICSVNSSAPAVETISRPADTIGEESTPPAREEADAVGTFLTALIAILLVCVLLAAIVLAVQVF